MMKPYWFAALLCSGAAAVCSASPIAEGTLGVSDHLRIHYLQAGSANAANTLLLIPGWRISSAIWSKQILYFSTHGYRVIAIDSRSQGGSSVSQSANAPEDRARDIHDVIAAMHLVRLTLVGWSQGAQDVAAYIDRYGTNELKGVALVDSSVSAGPADAAESPGFVKSILQGIGNFSRDPRGYSDGMMHSIISSPTPSETFARLDEESLKTPVDVSISMLIQDLFTTDRRPNLKKFNRPTLVVASAESRLLDEQKEMVASLPQGQLVVVERAAHAVFFDQPEEFNRKLDQFVLSIQQPDLRESQSP